MKLFHLNSKKKAFEKEKIYTEQHKKDYAEKTERCVRLNEKVTSTIHWHR